MQSQRISASSYSNTAPLVWSFLYGKNQGKVELIMDTAPARSAELLSQDRVDAALVPVIAYQMIDGVSLVPDVCVGARQRVRSVCLITNGGDLEDVRSVSLDTSSRTSVVLTKIIFREFLGFEPEWREGSPDIDAMLIQADAALLIGDPALKIANYHAEIAYLSEPQPSSGRLDPKSKVQNLRSFDLAQLWHKYTGFGFVFAMWMTRRNNISIDFAEARDEGCDHLEQIISNYETEITLNRDEMREYLSENISYSVDESMARGLDLYFELAKKDGLIRENKPLSFTRAVTE